MNFVSKVCIGSAQFGLNYGINNREGQMHDIEVYEILNTLRRNGIALIDTAPAYGQAESVIGKSQSRKYFNVITKIDPSAAEPSAVSTSFEKSLVNLDTTKAYGVMVHRPDVFFKNKANWYCLEQLKNNRKVEKIGVSIYDVQELYTILENGYVLDIVQLPFSVLDRRFLKILPEIKKMKIQVFSRSTFLQGLYFMDDKLLFKHFNSMFYPIKKLKNLAKKLEVSLNEYLLSFCLLQPDIDYVILGVDGHLHLNSNIQIAKNIKLEISDFAPLNQIHVTDNELLNPNNWVRGIR